MRIIVYLTTTSLHEIARGTEKRFSNDDNKQDKLVFRLIASL